MMGMIRVLTLMYSNMTDGHHISRETLPQNFRLQHKHFAELPTWVDGGGEVGLR
jgi:hypothetical protein